MKIDQIGSFEVDSFLAETPQIHQYRLLRELGHGGMGKVYEALHLRLKKKVALKVISPKFADNSAALERFEREMSAIGQLSHPHIVQALDAGVDNAVHYLAMELVIGENVEQIAARQKQLKIADACEIIRQAALGLAHAHRVGIIHRDLKPSNLLLAQSGEIKVADLGLARFLFQSEIDVLTAPGIVMGTYDYMSPEQANGQLLDAASDLYSLGATLFRLVSGQPLFIGPKFGSPARKLYAHIHELPPSLISLRPEVSVELDGLVQQLLSKQPHQRPKSAADVAEALLAFSANANLTSIVSSEPSRNSAEITTVRCQPNQTVKPSNPTTTTDGIFDRLRRYGLAISCSLLILMLGMFVNRQRAAFSERKMTSEVPSSADAALASDHKLVENNLSTNHFEQIPSSDLIHFKSYKLLNQRPLMFIGENHVQSFLHFKQESRQLQLSSPAFELVRLGRLDHASFTLQLDLHRNNWFGQVGVLVGLRKATIFDGHIAQGFIIVKPLTSQGEMQLVRAHVKMELNRQSSYQITLDDKRAAEIKVPRHSSRKLEIEVQSDQLSSVRWGGEELSDLCMAEPNTAFLREDYRGDFGLYVNQSEVGVSNVELMITGKR